MNVFMDIFAFLTVSSLVKVICSMLVLRLVSNLFIVEKQRSHVAVRPSGWGQGGQIAPGPSTPRALYATSNMAANMAIGGRTRTKNVWILN